MKSLFRTVLAAFLLLFPQFVLHAGPGQPWDRLLDRYELICKKCLEMKNLRDAGENVPASQMKDLMDELKSLRTQLKGVSDKMPAAVRHRFDTIKQMYEAGFISDTNNEALLEVEPGTVMAKAFSLNGTPPSLAERKPVISQPRLRPNWTASASVVAFPDFAWGAMVSCTGKRWGGYVSFRSNYTFHTTEYEALSDGSSRNSRIWASGASASDRLFLTAGPVFSLTNWLSFFVGAGYGYRRVCWEDTDGLWMRISDISPSGLCTELGASLNVSRFSVSISWVALPPSYGAAALSLGYRF